MLVAMGFWEKAQAANDTLFLSARHRTLPILATVTPIANYPTKLRIFRTLASRYWQVRCFLRVKPWWFVTDAGKLALSVRYGTKVLELAKGKVAVEVGGEKDLVPTLELIKTAVLNGELDTQIEAAALKLRDGFAQ